MSQMSGVSLCYGKVNLPDQGQTVAVLRLKAPFDKAMSATLCGKAFLNTKEYCAATRNRDIGGGFTRQRVEHEQGTLILLQVSRTRRGVPHADGAMVLRLRNGADLLSISARLPMGGGSILGEQIQIFAGAADICAPEELALLGVKIPKWYAERYLDPQEVAQLFDVSVVRAGEIARPTLHAVATSEGVVIKAVGEEAPRRMRMRRNT